MAKKTKKIKKEKVMTVLLPKAETPPADAVENIIAAMASLQASTGWAIVVKILNDNITYLEKAILEKIDPVSQLALSNEEIEECRKKRNLSIELRDTPANYSKVVKEAGSAPPDYDPFFKTKEEIDKAKNAPPADRG